MRAAVDASGNEPGSFVLTGSSEPRKELARHSGAGRMAKLRMRTMALAEMGLSSGAVSLAGLFEGRFEPQLVQELRPHHRGAEDQARRRREARLCHLLVGLSYDKDAKPGHRVHTCKIEVA